MLRRAKWFERIILLTAGLLLIIPETITDIIGIVLIFGVILFQIFTREKVAAGTEAVATETANDKDMK